MQNRNGKRNHNDPPSHFQDLVPSFVAAGGAGMATTTSTTSSSTKDVENTSDHKDHDKKGQQEEQNPHATDHVGTADDDHHDSFLYLHYDRMCNSATAQDNHNEHHEEDDEKRCPRDHSCCHNVLGVLPPSSIPGHQQDLEPEQSPPSFKVDEEQHTQFLLQSFCSASLRHGRISQISAARSDYVDACPDTNDSSSEEGSFDDEIYRLFGDTNEQGAIEPRSNTGHASLKPRTTPCAASEDSMMVDSFVPVTTITRTKLKLVSPSPLPVFVNSQEGELPPTARNSTSCASTATNKSSFLPLCQPWWQSHDMEGDSFTPSSAPVSTQQHCPLSKEIPFREKQEPEEVPAIRAGGEITYAIMSSSHEKETFVLPKGIPMTPPPLLLYSSWSTTTTRTRTSATSPRPLVPFLIEKESSTSLDPESIDSPINAHLVSPLLPSRHMRASSPKTSSASAAHDTRRNPVSAQDQQARKRLLFGDDELKQSGLCSPASCFSFSHQIKKKSHLPPSLHEDHDKKNEDFDNGSCLQSMITTLAQTTTYKLLGSSWQSLPGGTTPTPGNGPCTFSSTSSPDRHDGATPPATSLLYPHDPRHILVLGKDKGIEAAPASSSSLSSTTDTKRLHFWDFQSRSWTTRFREAKAYRLKNGHCRIPENYPENIALGRWAKRQRSQYKVHQRTSCLSWCWGDKNSLVIQYQNHDHDDATSKNNTTTTHDNAEGSRRLASSSTTRLEYLVGQNCQEKESSFCPPTSTSSTRSSTTKNDDNWNEEDIETKSHRRNSPTVERLSACNSLTEERIRLLDSIGFVWDLQASDWFHRYDQLLEFKRIHGHTDIPQKYPQNQPLSTWVRTQRRSYIKGCMVSDRIELLDRTGFDWENPSAKKTRRM